MFFHFLIGVILLGTKQFSASFHSNSFFVVMPQVRSAISCGATLRRCTDRGLRLPEAPASSSVNASLTSSCPPMVSPSCAGLISWSMKVHWPAKDFSIQF